MANISQKVNLTANQRMDIAEFMAMQTNIENAVTRLVQLIGAPVVDPVTNIKWNVGGVLTASSITAVGADLKIGAGLEVMCKDGHIITQDADELITGVIPLGVAPKMLLAKPSDETPTTPDNRRFWDNATKQEINDTPNTVLTRQLVFSLVPNTAEDVANAVNTGDYVCVAAVSPDGMTASWQMAFPDSGTLELPSLLSIVKRLIGNGNENSGDWAVSCGGGSNTNSGDYSASSGGISNTNSGISSASSGGGSNTNSGDYSASSGGGFNTNSGDYSASSGGHFNTNLAAAIRGITLGGQNNTNGGLQSVILGQYCENATDDVICGGYAASLVPSGANQNLKWVISNRYGTAHFASDVKIGGNVNDGTLSTIKFTATGGHAQIEGNTYFGGDVDLTTDPRAKIIGATGNAYIGGNVEIGGTVTAGATASVAPTISITASTGAIAANGLVTAGGGVKTVTPVDVNAAWDSGSSTFLATMNTVGGVIAIDFSAHTVAAAFAGTQTLIVTNSALDLTSRIHITLDYDGALTKMPVFRMERRNGEFELVFFNAGSAAIDDVVLVQFDIINPA